MASGGAIADSRGGIVARTTAQGEATIMNVIARSSAVASGSVPDARGTREDRQGRDDHAQAVPLLDLLDEQLGGRFVSDAS